MKLKPPKNQLVLLKGTVLKCDNGGRAYIAALWTDGEREYFELIHAPVPNVPDNVIINTVLERGQRVLFPQRNAEELYERHLKMRSNLRKVDSYGLSK